MSNVTPAVLDVVAVVELASVFVTPETKVPLELTANGAPGVVVARLPSVIVLVVLSVPVTSKL